MSFITPFTFQKDDVLDGLKIIMPVDRGGGGEMYLAKDVTGLILALKVANSARDEREFSGIVHYRKLASGSKGLVPIYHSGKLPDGRFYCAMAAADNLAEWPEYEPDTLGNLLKHQGRVQAHDVLNFAEAILAGLKTLHEAGLAHRDVKPDNIIFVNGAPALTDFGLLSETASDDGGAIAGTPGFIPPEMIQNASNYDPKACDLFALGKVIYCTWSGADETEFPSVPDDAPLQEIAAMRSVYMTACDDIPRK